MIFHRRYRRQCQTIWVQQYEQLQIMRSAIPAAIFAVMGALLIWLAVPAFTPRPLPRPRYTSLSLTATPAELQKNLEKLNELALRTYIRRDLVRWQFLQIHQGYAQRIGNEGDLANALNNLTDGLSDPWARTESENESRDRILRQQGKIIGVDLDFQWDAQRKAWKISKVSGTAAAAGVKAEDLIISIDGDDPSQFESNQSDGVKQLLLGFPPDNLVDSMVALTVRRGTGEEREFEIPRVVTGTQPACKSEAATVGTTRDDTIQVVTGQNFRSETFIRELTEMLTAKREHPLRGLVLDLAGCEGGTSETAALAAALFTKEGVVSRAIINDPTKPLSYYVQSWVVAAGKVKLVEQGPLQQDGQQPLAQTPERVIKEIAATTNIFEGPIAIVIDWQTRGAPELFAEALRSNDNDQRVSIFGWITTWGKGLGQTTFSNAGPFSLTWSTSYQLTSRGHQLERRAIRPNAETQLNRGDNEQAAAVAWLTQRLETIPEPLLPKD